MSFVELASGLMLSPLRSTKPSPFVFDSQRVHMIVRSVYFDDILAFETLLKSYERLGLCFRCLFYPKVMHR
jgi:hypothetical protein